MSRPARLDPARVQVSRARRRSARRFWGGDPAFRAPERVDLRAANAHAGRRRWARAVAVWFRGWWPRFG